MILVIVIIVILALVFFGGLGILAVFFLLSGERKMVEKMIEKDD